MLSFKVSDKVVFTNSSYSLSPYAIRAVDAMVSWSDSWSSQDTLSGTSVSAKSSKEALAARLVLAGLTLYVPFEIVTACLKISYCAAEIFLLSPSASSSSERLSWNPHPTLHWSWVETHLVLWTPLKRILRVGSVIFYPWTRCGSWLVSRAFWVVSRESWPVSRPPWPIWQENWWNSEAYGGTSLKTWVFFLEIQPAWLISCWLSHVWEQVMMNGQPDCWSYLGH